ncbi:MAG: hypothetical protein V4792_15875 [Pseudomonadota bacterium]
MSKLLYLLAFLCLAMGIVDTSDWIGPRREVAAGILFLLAPVLALAGYAVSHAPTRKCPHCNERNKRDASICKHCGRSPHLYRKFFPSS